MDEKKLIQGCSRNDRKSQEVLYRRFFPEMMRMCLRYTRDEHRAMEIVNTGFLRVFKKIDSFRDEGSLEGWIRRIVFHSLSDFYRKKSNNIHFLDLELVQEPRAEDQINNLYVEDILKSVEELPDASRKVFILYALEGYKHHEIADLLGISTGTSKWHLSEARKKLKKLLIKNSKILLDSNTGTNL